MPTEGQVFHGVFSVPTDEQFSYRVFSLRRELFESVQVF
jgi:hypothetical protein